MLSDVFRGARNKRKGCTCASFKLPQSKRKFAKGGAVKTHRGGKTVTRLAFVGAKHNSATGVSDNTCCAATRA